MDRRPVTPPVSRKRAATQPFRVASTSGDTQTLAQVLAKDAVLYSDGGVKRAAALNPIRGAERISRFFAGVRAIIQRLPRSLPATVNGFAGFVMRENDGSVDTLAIEHSDGRVVAIYLTRKPEKLQHVRVLGMVRLAATGADNFWRIENCASHCTITAVFV